MFCALNGPCIAYRSPWASGALTSSAPCHLCGPQKHYCVTSSNLAELTWLCFTQNGEYFLEGWGLRSVIGFAPGKMIQTRLRSTMASRNMDPVLRHVPGRLRGYWSQSSGNSIFAVVTRDARPREAETGQLLASPPSSPFFRLRHATDNEPYFFCCLGATGYVIHTYRHAAWAPRGKK